MATFIDREAEISEESEDSDVSQGSEPAAKRPKKQKQKRRQISSDEDDEDEVEDDAKIREEMKDFIADEVDEDGEEEAGDDAADDDDRSDKAASDVSDDLLEEDLDLLNENYGRKVGGRVEISDDEDDRERIKGDLFGPGDDLDETKGDLNQSYRYDEEESHSESEQSEDPFIVHDDEQERRRRRKGQRSAFNDQILDEAKDVFGVEDIDDFYEDDEAFEEEVEEGEEGVISTTKQRGTKVSLMSSIEPSELAKGFVRAEDKKIICEDRPERFQTRKIPVTEVDDHDLNLETAWIHEYAFKEKTISKQEGRELSILKINQDRNSEEALKAEHEAPEKIREAIRFIRCQFFEVPFIAFYRKEYVESSLLMSDLWKVYMYDEKWCRLQQRKGKITDLLKRVQQYILTSGFPETERLRKVTEKDFDDVVGVQTNEELSDVYAHFQLYYGSEMSRMQEWKLQTAQDDLDSTIAPKYKLCGRTDKYQLCVQCGLGPMAEQFGLTAEEYSENREREYVRNEIRQCQVEPKECAKEFITENFPSPEKVIEGALYMLAQQFSREPAVRKKMRMIYRERLKFSVYPTKKGRNEIDENHPLWRKHYIKEKPVNKLESDEYIQYMKARDDGLIEFKFHADTAEEMSSGRNLLSYMSKDQVFFRDEYFYVVEEWNKLRQEVLRVCCYDILVPVFEREVHETLMEEARDCILRKASNRLYDMIKTEVYKPTFRYMNEEDDQEDTGTRILSICYSSDSAEASFALVIDQDGVVLDHQRLVHFTKRANSRFPEEARLKTDDLKQLQKFITKRQPHVICINGEGMDALRLATDMRMLMTRMHESKEIPIAIPVEIVDNDPAKVYMNSLMAQQEFPDYPPLLRQAVSLARYLLDPMVEICHLCNLEDDILFINFHTLQSEVPKRDLLFAIQLECINRVNEVGVDINRCLEFPHTAGLLQFVCGLGPRKASHLLKILKQNDNLLESRTKLVTFCRMGPKVFMNASGFIKIDTAKVSEKTDSYVEVLDGSRVHPETYEWARKMAVDALEIEDPADPTGALEEILQYPERLKDLDLDAFAEELARQGFGNKSITLYDIRAELNYRYKDLRVPHVPAAGKELFDMLVKDSQAYAEGKLVNGTVIMCVYKKPTDQEKQNKLDKINHNTNLWECDLCKRDDFPDINDVYDHQKEECPGIPIGLRIRLDNGLTGFVALKNMSDKFESFRNPLKLLRPGQEHYFRVIKFDADRMQCDLSCKSSDLQGKTQKEDDCFDHLRFNEDKDADTKARRQLDKGQITKRVISHPSFHNITFKAAEQMLRKMDQGDAIIRPSAKSVNHLTVTWKVAEEIFQHIPVEEKQKTSAFEIGKKLYINDEEYEDLDEIIARHVQPMAACVRDIMGYKYYMEGVTAENSQVIEDHLKSEKKRTPARIPYVVTPSRKYPGRFVLSYLAQSKVKNEYMTAKPEGISFRRNMFPSAEELINWFKLNFNVHPNAAPTFNGTGRR